MMYEHILVEKENQVGTIILNHPETANAFAIESYVEVKQAIEEFGLDPQVRVIVITGNGKHFCAGGNIKRFKENVDSGTPLPQANIIKAGAMSDAVLRCPKPVIAMINGVAMGAGCALALACDFRVIAAEGKMGSAFINMAFSGDTGIMYFLYHILGAAKAMELMALGTPVSGEEALRLGLVTRLAPSKDTLQEVTQQLVNELLAKPTGAIARQKRLHYEFFKRDFLQFNIREADYMNECSRSADHKEAVNAFFEKRKPEFTGN